MKEMTVGERIQQLRRAAGISQEQLDVSRQSVSKWELNEAVPELSKIIALSELFGVSTDELLKGAEGTCAATERQGLIDAIARLNDAERRRMGFTAAIAGHIPMAYVTLIACAAITAGAVFMYKGYRSKKEK